MSDPNVKIEKNVPMLDARGGYPFKEMEIGDSFFVEGVKSRYFAGRAYQAGRRNDMKFSVRNSLSGCRCWRIA